MHCEALTDFLLEVACGLDAERLATVPRLVSRFTLLKTCETTTRVDAQLSQDSNRDHVRLGWVGAQVNLLNLKKIVGWVTAEIQGVVAWDLVLFLDRDLVATHP